MKKIWLKSYPATVPPEIDPNEFASIADWFAVVCSKFASRPAFRNLGKTITYEELAHLSRDFASWLQSLDLAPGARVALMMPNVLQYPVALFGGLLAGMTVVNVNPQYTARELEHQLKDSGAEIIVVLENFAHVVQRVLSKAPLKHIVIARVGDLLAAHRRPLTNFVVSHVKKLVPRWRIPHALGFRTVLRRGARTRWTPVSLKLQDIAFLQYTGGTTGTSKGAVLTHGNILANVLQASAWTLPVITERGETFITALPIYHIFCLTVNCLLGLHKGALNVLITNPRDMPGFVKELAATRFNVITGVNTLFNGLLNTPGFSNLDFSHLKFALGGGSAIQRAVAERWQDVTGHAMVQGYGLTEASPVVACSRFDEDYDGSVGPPFPSTQVAVFDEQDCQLPPSRVGEIGVRGPQVMRGYWERPDETELAFTSDGWLRTGDIGFLDDRGHLWITDRKKDMIIVSGFNVYPNEVESVIMMHPGVLECAVVGVADGATGEAVKAVIVRKDPDLTSEAIVSFCRQSLTHYKAPKVIVFSSDLPKNQIGKVLRRELRS